MGMLRALRTLQCSCCGFTQLPVEALVGLEIVEELDFSGCREMAVRENVDSLAILRKLQVFSVEGCMPTRAGSRGLMRLVNALNVQEPSLRVIVESGEPETYELADGERHTLWIHV